MTFSGLQPNTDLHRLDETRLDDHYVMVKAYWHMHFVKEPEKPIIDENSASYLLFRKGDSLSIVFQLDHQDLMQRAQDLGLAAARVI